jgi:hypothetical protein
MNFDTHKYIKNLEKTGFNEQQAEVIVRSLVESRNSDLSSLATREQVTKVESKLKKKITTLANKIDNIEGKLDIFKWIIPIVLTNMAMMVTIAVRLFT